MTETNNERVGDRENEGNSQEEIETFVKEQKSENTTKKTVSDMKTFHRYLSSISKDDKEILNLPADDILHFPRGRENLKPRPTVLTSLSLGQYGKASV